MKPPLLPSYGQLLAENDRLQAALDNVWRCARAASVALRNAGLDPYQGREKQTKEEVSK
jgi:hypothetical protein